MKTKNIFIATLALLAFTITACKEAETQRDIEERIGNKMLKSARQELKAKNFDAARDTIMALRKQHQLAIDARRRGILLLDSIEMLAADDSLVKLNQKANEQNMAFLDDPTAPLFLDSATYVDEHERLYMKVEFFKRKLQEDWKKQTGRK